MRPSQRQPSQLRQVNITRHYTKYAEGSVLIEFGSTKVLCNASIIDGVPRFIKGGKQGWLTAEYNMLPRATHERHERSSAGKPNARNLEIQRLIGRSLRSVVNLAALGEYTIVVDCDVIQADGGTRTAAITGSCVAVVDALNSVKIKQKITKNPLLSMVASVSVGIYNNQPVLDLDYVEDSNAQTDMNVVMNEQGEFIEIQGTAETMAFSQNQLNSMLDLARSGISELFLLQKTALATAKTI